MQQLVEHESCDGCDSWWDGGLWTVGLFKLSEPCYVSVTIALTLIYLCHLRLRFCLKTFGLLIDGCRYR